jgi:hypothetical protein
MIKLNSNIINISLLKCCIDEIEKLEDSYDTLVCEVNKYDCARDTTTQIDIKENIIETIEEVIESLENKG